MGNNLQKYRELSKVVSELKMEAQLLPQVSCVMELAMFRAGLCVESKQWKQTFTRAADFVATFGPALTESEMLPQSISIHSTVPPIACCHVNACCPALLLATPSPLTPRGHP